MSNPFALLTASKEAVKEALRYLLLGTIAEGGIVVVQILISGINTQTGVVNVNWSVVGSVALFAFLTVLMRAIDKFKHTYEKELNPDLTGVSMGVLPF
jgi:hypothetical protein